MSQSRRYIDDLAYPEAHRHGLPDLYPRVGHRLDVADRDWTEFCNHCKEPLAIIETVRDKGQDFRDKATTVTRRLADRAELRSWLVAWRIERPESVQRRIDDLGRELMRLQTMHPIVGFTVRELRPRGPFVDLAPAEWWEHVLMIHRDHHRFCLAAKRNQEIAVREPRLLAAQNNSPIWSMGAHPQIPGLEEVA